MGHLGAPSCMLFSGSSSSVLMAGWLVWEGDQDGKEQDVGPNYSHPKPGQLQQGLRGEKAVLG